MGRTTKHHGRIAWEDRFSQPTVPRLREELPLPAAKLFDQLRQRVLDLDGIKETFSWRGPCWRWTVEFHTACSAEPLALVIPSPTDLQLAIPLDREFTRSLPVRRMKRAVRDGLELAQDPFDTRWGVWSLQSEGLLEDLQELIDLKLRYVSSSAP